MESFEALNLFAHQLRVNVCDGAKYKTKVVVTPSSVDEKGLIIKVSLLKTTLDTRTGTSKKNRTLRLRVAVCGRAESMTGLAQAAECIEKLDRYLSNDNLRLERVQEASNTIQATIKIPDTRIVQTVSAEDSFFGAPDSIAVQDVEDIRTVYITIADGKEE